MYPVLIEESVHQRLSEARVDARSARLVRAARAQRRAERATARARRATERVAAERVVAGSALAVR